MLSYDSDIDDDNFDYDEEEIEDLAYDDIIEEELEDLADDTDFD